MTLSPVVLALLGLLLTTIGTLLGGGIAWGALKNTVTQLRELVGELRSDVAKLSGEVGKLHTEVAVLRDRDDREPTGRHSTR